MKWKIIYFKKNRFLLYSFSLSLSRYVSNISKLFQCNCTVYLSFFPLICFSDLLATTEYVFFLSPYIWYSLFTILHFYPVLPFLVVFLSLLSLKPFNFLGLPSSNLPFMVSVCLAFFLTSHLTLQCFGSGSVFILPPGSGFRPKRCVN